MRPIGAVVIRMHGDPAGRKPALVLSAGPMMGGTLSIGLLPRYASMVRYLSWLSLLPLQLSLICTGRVSRAD